MVSGTNTTYLSNAVNRYFGCNLKQLVNEYRVGYAKQLLDSGECQIKDLFKKCGFTSKSVFYTAFNKRIGITPLKYLSHKNRNNNS